MQPKPVKKNGYNTGKSATNQDLVYQHMSNHYRRILNAKKTVDTSPPYCYKARRPLNSTSKNVNYQATKPKKPVFSRNTSPALTERSISNNSCKGSCWGTESYACSSRYHASCIPDCPIKATVKYTCFDMDLVNQITYDTKNGPATYCDEGWMEIKAQRNDRFKIPYEQSKTKNEISSSGNVPKRQIQQKTNEANLKRKFPIQKKLSTSNTTAQSHPRIPKTEAVSKLRNMRVYYPPRKREIRIKNENASDLPEGPLVSPSCKCTKICVCDTNEGSIDFKKTSENPKEQSQTSSRDSAYNGGISSLPESRSPTPDQRRKKECCCSAGGEFYCKRKQVKINNEKKDETKSLNNSKCREDYLKEVEPCQPLARATSPQCNTKNTELLRKIKEDSLYIKFIQDITVEVLEKCLYTNKALKIVMKKHVLNNLHTLDKDRMIKEVEILRKQLGIPEDKNFLDLSLGVIESSSDLINSCPVISDSEFVIPKNLLDCSETFPQDKNKQSSRKECSCNETSGQDTSFKSRDQKEMENLKTALASESDDDEISTEELFCKREKGKEKNKGKKESDPSRGNSADESDQSSDNKTRTKIQIVKKQVKSFVSSYSSSSESENFDKTLSQVPTNDETKSKREKSELEEENFSKSLESLSTKKSGATGGGSKGRNVIFRNKETKIGESIEIKHTKVLTRRFGFDEKEKDGSEFSRTKNTESRVWPFNEGGCECNPREEKNF